jgi:hypothetical protein
MFDTVWVWALRAVWASLPLTAGGLVADAVDGRSGAVRLVAAALAWAGWGLGLVAALIPHVVSLTALRLLFPGAFAGAVVAAVAGPELDATAWMALAATACCAILAMGAPIGERWIDAMSYGDESRLPLRPPGLLLLGPLPLAAAVPIAVTLAGPLLLAARQWLPGGAVVLVGGAASAVLVRSLHALTARWFVLVPAGLVLHDHLALADPVLFRRPTIQGLGPALADTTARDFTQQSPGPALELRLKEPAQVSPRAKRGEAERLEEVSALLFSPTRPGRALTAAAARHIRIA